MLVGEKTDSNQKPDYSIISKLKLIKMNSQIKQQWIEALRSNEYEQTTAYLRTQQGYCCLGVLCDLYAWEHDDVEWDRSNNGNSYEFLDAYQALPDKVMKWAGLSHADPYYVVADEETGERNIHLSTVNDNGSTFEEIAQLIEEKF
jgi:hypothetical protein